MPAVRLIVPGGCCASGAVPVLVLLREVLHLSPVFSVLVSGSVPVRVAVFRAYPELTTETLAIPTFLFSVLSMPPAEEPTLLYSLKKHMICVLEKNIKNI